MLLAVISDTHDHVENIRKAVAIIKQRKPDLVIHLGDFVAPLLIPEYKGLPLVGVLGNNDGDVYRLQQQFTNIGAHLAGEAHTFELAGKRCIAYHGTQQALVAGLAADTYDLVLYGHTHKREERTESGTLVVNPGSVHGFDDEATLAFITFPNMDVEFVQLR